MDRKRVRKLFSMMLALLMVTGLFPLTAQAADLTIISAPADWAPYVSAGVIELNAGDALTITATAGSPSGPVKIQINGSCTINGSSEHIENLSIEEHTSTVMSVTLNNVHITAPANVDTYRQYKGTIHLIGANELIAGGTKNAISGGSAAITIESAGGGSLTAQGGGTAINATPLVIKGNAQVTAKSGLGNAAASASSYTVESGATLIMEGTSRGISTTSDVNIANDGTMAVSGATGNGIYAKNLTYSGTGILTVTGSDLNSGISLTSDSTLTISSGIIKASGGATGNAIKIAGASPNIVIGTGTLEMTNKASASEIHTFTMSADGDPWSISGDNVTHTGNLSDNSIVVTVPANTTGTVKRGTDTNATIDIAAIGGVAAPTTDAVPVTSIAPTDQFTGSLSWAPAVDTCFEANTVYTATITLTPKSGYTLTGVSANFFAVEGASSVSNDADSGVITATFPATAPAPSVPGGPTGEAVWHTRGPLPAAKLIEDIEYINGKYMAVGYNGTLLTSSDGVNWQKIQVGADLDYPRGIAYGGGKFVIVGNAGDNDYAARIYTSSDGTTWYETASVPHHRLCDVAYGEGKFVAVGMYGKILVSSDGESWVTKTVTYPAGQGTTLQSITYSDEQSKFVAAGTSGISSDHKGGIMTSEDGENWTVTYSDSVNSLWDVTYGNGTFVAVGGKDTGAYCIVTSSDGATWTSRGTGYAELFSVEFSGTQFVAAGRLNPGTSDTAFTTTSTNGTNWAGKAFNGLPGFRAVASNSAGTQLVAMGSYGNIYTSDNSVTSWDYQTLGTTKTLKDVAWNGSDLYIAVGDKGMLQTSPDGQTWTIRFSSTNKDLNKVDYLNNQFIAVGKSGTILTSTDGISWTSQVSETEQELKDLAYGGGKYVVVGGDAYYNPIVLTSADNGTTWSKVTNDPAFINITFVTVTYGDGVFMALNKNGWGYRSENGTAWTQIAVLPGTSTQNPTDIMYAGDKFVAVGGYGKIYLSSNKGDSWTTVDSGLSIYSWGVTEGSGNLVAVGDNGRIIASADGGTTWLAQPSGLTLNHYYINEYIRLNGIVASGNCFVAVGENGLVLQSEDFTVSTDVDAHDVSIAKPGLGIHNILSSNDHAGLIVKNMSLPTSWVNGTAISWYSSKPVYIATDGTVTRPSFSIGDQVVYLTATITKGSASETKTFIVVVLAHGDPDISDANAAAAALTFDTIKGSNTAANNITHDLTLPVSGTNETSISWASSNPDYITTSGAVTRPEAGSPDQVVTLTATITKNAASTSKTFTLTVKAKVGPTTPAHTATAEAATLTPVAGADNTITLKVKNSSGNIDTAFTGGHNVTISGVGSVNGSNYGVFDGVHIGAGGTLTKTITFTAGVATPILKLPKAAEQIISFSIDGVNTPQTNTLTFTPVPETPTVTVTFELNGGKRTGGGELTQTLPSGGSATAPTVTRSNYTFLGWDKDFDNVTSNLTVTANWRYEGGGGGGGSTVNAYITPKEAVFDKDPDNANNKNVAVTLNSGSYSLSGILVDGKALVKGTDYIVSGSTVTFQKDYLATLEDGKHQFTFDMNGGADPVLTITITDKTNPGTGAPIPFEDVKADDWFADDVMWAYENGLMVGTSSSTFSPHATTTRGMIITILHRLEGSPTAGANPFSDVEVGKYYTDAVSWAAEKGIVSGYGNGNFGTEDAVTREQMAVILMNYAKLKGYDVSMRADLSKFTDADLVSSWAKDAMSWANAAGLIQGSGNKLMPTGNAERCQVAAILQRFIENIAK